jgi:predicted unusual protein kinase regulating ubiquinone biosynthesis (AarF/ABC1/UbiB family)
MGSGVDRRPFAVRAGRLRRTIAPARVAGRAAAGWAASYLAWGEKRRLRRERVVLRTAEDVTRTLGEMKGAAMKVGQVLSLMAGVVPPEMAGQLATLHANAPPMDYRLVERVVAEELGGSPQTLFRKFEREPFAAASIGQVHRAVTRDGERVAVKVQYPGVREAIDADLANIGVLFALGGRIAEGMDVGRLVADLAAGIRAELDYRQEAAWQTRYAETFAGHAFIRVPRVLPGLSAARVLTQEYLDGRPFATAVSLDQPARDEIAEKLFRFAFGNFYQHRLFNGDPHPGNYLLLEDGQIGFVDYGCVASFEREAVDGLKALLMALYDDDRERWRAATEEVGILRPGAPFTTAQLYDHMHWFWKPVLTEEVTFTPELAAEMVRRNTQTSGEGGAINRHLSIPPGMVFLSRINFGLAGVFGMLNARRPWRAIIAEYLYGTPPSTPIGEASAATMRGKPV